MQMRFSDDDLITLAEMLTLACWVSSLNHLPGSDVHAERFEKMLDRILDRMGQMGMNNLLEVDHSNGQIQLKKSFEDKSYALQTYDEMRSVIFWEDLMVRLADRIMVKRYGKTKWEAKSEEQRRQLAAPTEQVFWDELQKNGFENIHLIHPPEA